MAVLAWQVKFPHQGFEFVGGAVNNTHKCLCGKTFTLPRKSRGVKKVCPFCGNTRWTFIFPGEKDRYSQSASLTVGDNKVGLKVGTLTINHTYRQDKQVIYYKLEQRKLVVNTKTGRVYQILYNSVGKATSIRGCGRELKYMYNTIPNITQRFLREILQELPNAFPEDMITDDIDLEMIVQMIVRPGLTSLYSFRDKLGDRTKQLMRFSSQQLTKRYSYEATKGVTDAYGFMGKLFDVNFGKPEIEILGRMDEIHPWTLSSMKFIINRFGQDVARSHMMREPNIHPFSLHQIDGWFESLIENLICYSDKMIALGRLIKLISHVEIFYLVNTARLSRMLGLDMDLWKDLGLNQDMWHNTSNRLQNLRKSKGNAIYRKSFDSAVPKMSTYEYTSGEYCIVAPKTMEDVISEGSEMHHCVGNYIPMIAGGESTILFVRGVDGSRKATIEIKGDWLAQASGKHNSFPDNEVINFLEEWCRKFKIDCGVLSKQI